jgi:hypothetical protein
MQSKARRSAWQGLHTALPGSNLEPVRVQLVLVMEQWSNHRSKPARGREDASISWFEIPFHFLAITVIEVSVFLNGKG